MRQLELVACQPRPDRQTTIAGKAAATPDRLGGVFSAEAPGTRLVGDITYIPTWQGWLYLATVIDCHTKAVVGWSMNGLAKRVKRAAFGLRNFTHWRIRVLLYAGKPDWSKLATVTP
jgi:transposase InsO family protein